MRPPATGVVFRVARYAVHDGPGIRTTVFLKGCPLRCWWCHSPESQAARQELVFRADRCTECGTCLPACPEHAVHPAPGGGFVTDRSACRVCGTCTRACPSGARELAGRTYTVPELMTEIVKDVVFFDESGGGVTFSGGEPLVQPAFLEAALERCRDLSIHTAVDTCGFADPGVVARVAELADLFLFDLKVIDPARHLEVTGVGNELILANLRQLVSARTPVRIRVPLVPGVNDDAANIEAIGELVASLGLRRVDLLPYHRAGIAKYERLDERYRLPDTRPPNEAGLAAAVSTLQRFGLQVHVGG